jgi:hypothetical protein
MPEQTEAERITGVDRELKETFTSDEQKDQWKTTGEHLNPVKVGNVIKAKLINLKLPYQVVAFDFNPASITVTKTVWNKEKAQASGRGGLPGGSSGSIFRGAERTKIDLRQLLLEGGDVKRRADQLIDWGQPAGGLLGQVVAGAATAVAAGRGRRLNLATKLPVITFQWGPPALAFMMDCTVESVQVEYVRFDRSGVPNRAKVTMSLREEPSLLGVIPTNPTSGGLPGRERHVVTEGETLMSIATATYGRPQYWRALAEANAIHDPLRVRPGRVVFLPAPSELLSR